MKTKDVVWLIALILADQISKAIVASRMTLQQSIEIIPGFFYLTYVHNTGAAWSILEGWGLVFSLLALAVGAGILYYLARHPDTAPLERVSLIAIAAGAWGNMIDRVRLGYVVDFLHFYPFGYDFPVFNVADCCLTVGVILLVVYEIFFDKEARP